ncbi:MAG TPA: DNA primase small subunit domain-containing protein [Nitrososphaeraceae archaeon]|nr:DNA primase small subunit domain-containing protein [Nitrososphaeraceae archaeon]
MVSSINKNSYEKNMVLLRSAFREYYFKHSNIIEIPERVEEREFGFMLFEAGMIRHLSFRNIGELLATLIKEVPSDVYCSNAYYRFPTYDMHEKQWMGADLIFDIDAKDLHLPCELMHSYILCANCGEPQEIKADVCIYCKTGKLNHVSIPCNKCNYGLKKEVKHLIDLLISDLGIKEKNINIYFSGNNGYHIHISDKEFRRLDSQARSDITSYLIGNDMMTESIGIRKAEASGDGFLVKFPKSGMMYGWRRRIAQKLGIDQTSTTKLRNMVQQKGGYSGFKAELLKMAKDMGVRIDPQVTMDVHRIFRMAGTLNSKSGLTKIRCNNEIESFDPLNDACLLSDKEVNVEMKVPIKLKLRGQSFKIRKETARIPVYAAVYLICKGLARVN